MTSASFHDPYAPAHDQRPLIDRVAADCGNGLWLVARILIGSLFVQSGLGKLIDLPAFAGMLAASGVPMAEAIAPADSRKWPPETTTSWEKWASALALPAALWLTAVACRMKGSSQRRKRISRQTIAVKRSPPGRQKSTSSRWW